MTAIIKRHPLVSFFVLANLLSWLAWVPYVLSHNGLGVWDYTFPNILGTSQLLGMLPGAYLGPITSALIVTAITGGAAGLRRWGARLWKWRVRWHWYAITLLSGEWARRVAKYIESDIWRCDMPASVLLRSARESAALTQAELGRLAKTSQSDISFVERGQRSPSVSTLERLLRASLHSLVAIPTLGPDASTTGERIASALALSHADAALRAFIDYSDALQSTAGTDRIALALARPARTGVPVWDAALAALVDHWLSEAELPQPAWINDDDRFLGRLTEPIEYANAPRIGRADIPPAFLRRNVALERGTLASV